MQGFAESEFALRLIGGATRLGDDGATVGAHESCDIGAMGCEARNVFESSQYGIVEEWLMELVHSYEVCTSYLAFADTFVAVDRASLDAYHLVIRAKLEHPQACTAELAGLAGLSSISSSTLHAYLKRYQGKAQKMLA